MGDAKMKRGGVAMSETSGWRLTEREMIAIWEGKQSTEFPDAMAGLPQARKLVEWLIKLGEWHNVSEVGRRHPSLCIYEPIIDELRKELGLG